MTLKRRTGEIVGSVATLVLGTAYFLRALRMPFWGAGGIPGGGFLPTLLGAGMILLSLLLLGRTMAAKPASRQEAKIEWGAIRKPLYILVALVGYLVLFRILGYVLASVVLIGVLFWAFDPQRSVWRRAMIASSASILIVALFYIVFVILLALEIPVWPFGS
jgi:hypothetical protein